MSVHIKTAAADGIGKIHIQLHPEDIGGVEISIKVSHDQTAQVHVVADRQQTLDMLSRDAGSLQRALSEAGIKADTNSLQFELRGGQDGQAKAGGDGQQQNGGYPKQKDDGGEIPRIQEVNDNGMYRLVSTNGINIRV